MSLNSEIYGFDRSGAGWQMLQAQSISCAPRFTPSMWVQLLNPPTAYSSDQGRLLCQVAEDQWLAWVPDYGELLLTTDEFCSLSED
ncbi:MAG: hypothetical protein J0L70_12305 [Leptolyngbya sp. UWPOB_LEPTO1]|uniref:hypothetical protein n=1 Tax=Leptolyngbya sp. UWPOB_LEPTO1 TaxID=2815653 RepID=UPI001ACF9218|nr:hypothetical protein [Leptolyngbya sp. UWPOB_LEPTO1]MBN8561302.1 hypothetical protein [Leptolyngbya sp. UWPOB_LEPTO1]